MKIAFLSDIHANLPALTAALDAARSLGAERIVIAGDVVGDGPFPVETVRRLMAEEVEAIRGNVDRAVIELLARKPRKLEKRAAGGKGAKANRAWTALELGAEERDWLCALPEQLEFSVNGVAVLVVHGSPLGDTDYLYPSLTEAALAGKLEPYRGPTPGMLVAGHSHVPFARIISGTTVVNCGTVGRPSDGDPRGSLAIATFGGSDAVQVEILRFTFAVDEVTSAVREREVPGIRAEEYTLGIKA